MSKKKAPRPGDQGGSDCIDVVKKYENSVPHKMTWFTKVVLKQQNTCCKLGSLELEIASVFALLFFATSEGGKRVFSVPRPATSSRGGGAGSLREADAYPSASFVQAPPAGGAAPRLLLRARDPFRAFFLYLKRVCGKM
jgi:hypothetical protein